MKKSIHSHLPPWTQPGPTSTAYNHIRVICPCWAEAWGQAGSFKLNFSRLINCFSPYNSTALAFPHWPLPQDHPPLLATFFSLSLRPTSHSHFPKITQITHSLLAPAVVWNYICCLLSFLPSISPEQQDSAALVPGCPVSLNSAWPGRDAAKWGLTHSGTLSITMSMGLKVLLEGS